MLDFEITNEAKISIDKKWLKKVVLAFQKNYALGGRQIFSLVMVSGRTIRKINRLYRGEDKITDVLSFSEDEQDLALPRDGNFFGEILICVPQAEKQAKELGWPLKNEIARLLIHGLAHLAGYEHEGVSSKKAKEMFEFEKSVLGSILNHGT